MTVGSIQDYRGHHTIITRGNVYIHMPKNQCIQLFEYTGLQIVLPLSRQFIKGMVTFSFKMSIKGFWLNPLVLSIIKAPVQSHDSSY